MGMRGVYREIIAPERLQYTETFDDFAHYGSALVTATLVERDGKDDADEPDPESVPQEVRDARSSSPAWSTAPPRATIRLAGDA